ncbi:MAG: rhodanese-related sulfurtransferase [Flavobacterium sp.]|jgi:rhodanese-related sulfurtransferase
MKIRSVFLLLVSFFIFSCNGQTPKEIKKIEAKAFAEIIKTTQKPQILDVRTPEEFKAGHLENSNNVNWLGDSFVKNSEKYNKTKPVFVYCRSGARSKKATEKLQELGFRNIYELEGGFLKWDEEGLSKI